MRVLFGLRAKRLTVQNSHVPDSIFSNFIIELTNGAELTELAEQKLAQYKFPFLLTELHPEWGGSKANSLGFVK